MRRIAIVARAPSSRYLAPFSDGDWEIWTLSPQGEPVWSDLPRWDRYYEIHPLEEKNAECPGYIQWLSKWGDQVWLREPHKDLPDAKVYPKDEVVSHFNKMFVHPLNYYNNSVSLMMAHAIVEGCDELGLWGVDMCAGTEYATQKPSCELFCGLAAGAGILVNVNEVCDLLKTTRIYGLEDPTAFEAKMKVHGEELDKKLQRHHDELNQAKHQHVGSAAAHGELSGVLNQLNGSEELKPVKELIMGRLKELEDIGIANKQICDRLDSEIKMCTGALEENRYIRQWQE